MTINELKIKCTIEGITQLKKKNLIDKISLTLKEDGYAIINISDSEIEFEPIKDFFSRMRGLSSYRIYRGIFVIVEDGNNVQLELIYFIPYAFFLLVMIITLLMGVFSDPIDFLFSIFALLAFLADIFKRRNVARRLFLELLGS